MLRRGAYPVREEGCGRRPWRRREIQWLQLGTASDRTIRAHTLLSRKINPGLKLLQRLKPSAKSCPVRGTLLLLSGRNSTCLLPGRRGRSARVLEDSKTVQQMASSVRGGTEPTPRFTVPLAIARLSYRVQGTPEKARPTPHGCEWTCESRIHPAG
jgi:hypothetical protein